MKSVYIFLCVVVALLAGCTPSPPKNDALIHAKGTSFYDILVPENPTPPQQFAAEELAEYLQQITGSKFTIQNARRDLPVIKLTITTSEYPDDYSIEMIKKDMVLNGSSGRALLFATYDFLERLGCLWVAPDFTYYKGNAEVIPHKTELKFTYHKKVKEHPVLAYRKLDVAGARASTADNLIRLVEWMPKVRYNTLRFAMDKPGHGKDKWNKWREAVAPEMQKRGLIIEVGGHGYQNFLNAEMMNGMLFQKHPDWFGKDSLCHYSPSNRLVFNTENPLAVNFFIKNVLDYLKSHPEIKIFDLWPPDVGRWSDCPDWEKFGSPQDRQTHLTNQVNAAIRQEGLSVKTEMIAYSYALQPPEIEVPDEDILLEICPINQNFEYQINNPVSVNNREYVNAIHAWRKTFEGSITYYSYYRKQAWRSLANIIPHYLQKDMQWIASVPLNGISCYAEQGDWFAYELNHYTLAHLAWDTSVNLDTLMTTYFKTRYAEVWQPIESIYQVIEETVPVYGSIPYSSLKSTEAIQKAKNRIIDAIQTTKKMRTKTSSDLAKENLTRLLLVLQYIDLDLAIQQARSSGMEKDKIENQIHQLVKFLEENSDQGVFILTGNNDFARFTKKYGLTNQSLLD